MKPQYDDAVGAHYNEVARQSGASPSATMADEIIRAKETKAILDFVRRNCKYYAGDGVENMRGNSPLTLVDVGCGNGYTLTEIAKEFPTLHASGIEYNDAMREHAKNRVSSRPGDLRDFESLGTPDGSVDLVICQRVIINLLDLQDQKTAMNNIARMLRPGGEVLFIEVFESGIARLNEARTEFDLANIPAAIHNLPLPDDFFDHPDLEPTPLASAAPNLLSTHYFVTRVLHDVALAGKEPKRNSHFVRFMSAALPDSVGNFAPLRFITLRRKTS